MISTQKKHYLPLPHTLSLTPLPLQQFTFMTERNWSSMLVALKNTSSR